MLYYNPLLWRERTLGIIFGMAVILMVKPQKTFLTRKEAASYLDSIGCPISVRTLEQWASNGNAGRGPSFLRIRSRIIRYRRDDLDAFAYRETEVVT